MPALFAYHDLHITTRNEGINVASCDVATREQDEAPANAWLPQAILQVMQR